MIASVALRGGRARPTRICAMCLRGHVSVFKYVVGRVLCSIGSVITPRSMDIVSVEVQWLMPSEDKYGAAGQRVQSPRSRRVMREGRLHANEKSELS